MRRMFGGFTVDRCQKLRESKNLVQGDAPTSLAEGFILKVQRNQRHVRARIQDSKKAMAFSLSGSRRP